MSDWAYWTRWLEIPDAYYRDSPAHVQRQIRERVTALKADPYPPDADYDVSRDSWTATFGDGSGIITYSVVEANKCVLILRLLSLS